MRGFPRAKRASLPPVNVVVGAQKQAYDVPAAQVVFRNPPSMT